jgi:hypothetical protein
VRLVNGRQFARLLESPNGLLVVPEPPLDLGESPQLVGRFSSSVDERTMRFRQVPGCQQRDPSTLVQRRPSGADVTRQQPKRRLEPGGRDGGRSRFHLRGCPREDLYAIEVTDRGAMLHVMRDRSGLSSEFDERLPEPVVRSDPPAGPCSFVHRPPNERMTEREGGCSV